MRLVGTEVRCRRARCLREVTRGRYRVLRNFKGNDEGPGNDNDISDEVEVERGKNNVEGP